MGFIISWDFLDDIKQRLEAHQSGGAVVDPAIITAVVWNKGELFLLRKNGSPVSLLAKWSIEQGKEIAKELDIPFEIA